MISSSGGAHTSGTNHDDSAKSVDEGAPTTAPAEAAETPVEESTTPVVDEAPAEEPSAPSIDTMPAKGPTPPDSNGNRTLVANDADANAPTIAATGADQFQAEAPSTLRTAGDPTADDQKLLTTTTFALTDDSSAQLASTAVTAVETALPTSLTSPVTIRSIVADVLRWFGLAPLGANSPFPDDPLPPPLELLWFFVRRVEYTFFNDAPTTAQVVNEQNAVTGVVTGRIIAEDGDGDALTYTVADEQNGHATVDELGNFVFTPNEATAEHGGPASFTVTVSDRAGNPLHLHGPLDMFGLVGPSTETVSMTIVNSAPEFAGPAFEIDSVDENGVVRGHMIANDEDDAQDDLTYALGADLIPLSALSW